MKINGRLCKEAAIFYDKFMFSDRFCKYKLT